LHWIWNYSYVKLIRYQFWCTRCTFRLIKSLQWYSVRKRWKFQNKENCRRAESALLSIVLIVITSTHSYQYTNTNSTVKRNANFINSSQNDELFPSCIALSFDGFGSISWYAVCFSALLRFHNLFGIPTFFCFSWESLKGFN
jgi:hypothetical protein